jgi:hypothetical protein
MQKGARREVLMKADDHLVEVSKSRLESLQLLEDVLNRSPAVIFRWRPVAGWPVEYVSSNVRQFGYSPADFLSGRFSRRDIICMEDIPRLEREVSRYLARARSSFSQEFRIMTAGGEVRWITGWNNVSRGRRGTITHMEEILLDVTVQRKDEEHGKIRGSVRKALIPICASCKRIRDGEGEWMELEAYMSLRGLARFSHGVCPTCLKTLYPECSHPERPKV